MKAFILIVITLFVTLVAVDAQVGVGNLVSDFEREQHDGVAVETTFDTAMTKEMANMPPR